MSTGVTNSFISELYGNRPLPTPVSRPPYHDYPPTVSIYHRVIGSTTETIERSSRFFTATSSRAPEALTFNHYAYLGSHFEESGVTFRVFAPDALKVQVSLKKDGKDSKKYDMALNDKGVWEFYAPDLKEGSYQYLITTKSGAEYRKADPFALQRKKLSDPFFTHESVISSVSPALWGDRGWLETRSMTQGPDAPVSIYSIHSLHWIKLYGTETPSYAKLGELLAAYCEAEGFTHIQFEDLLDCINPLQFDTCWNFFTPSYKLGTITQLQTMINELHQKGIGVIMRMPLDKFDPVVFGLNSFDGHPLFQREGETTRFDFTSRFAKEYMASALDFWAEIMHIDGFVFADGILSSSAPSGEYYDSTGARLIQELVALTHQNHPGVLMIGEGTLPSSITFDYTKLPNLTIHPNPKAICNLSSVTPKTKDLAEVTTYRMDLCRMFFYPGIKCLSMGEEFGQPESWKDRLPKALSERLTTSVDWEIAKSEPYASINNLTKALNQFYAEHPALSPRAPMRIHPTSCPELECFERIDNEGTESLFCIINTSSEQQDIKTSDGKLLDGYELCFTSIGDSSFIKDDTDPRRLGKIGPGSMLVFKKNMRG